MLKFGNETEKNIFPDGLVFAVPAAVLIVMIVFGNFLVIISVILDRKLKSMIQNWFIVSLAMADFLVGLLIMPLSLIYELLGEWVFGRILCDLWLALDVLFVTASILNLCLISLDRYWSIANAIIYLNKRTPRRSILMIATVWIMALLISFPPLVGWRAKPVMYQCNLSTDPGYVCYSAFGSFFIPVSVLIFVYAKIFYISRRRNKARRDAAKKSCEAMKNARTTSLDSDQVSTAANSLLAQAKKASSEASGLGHVNFSNYAHKLNSIGQNDMMVVNKKITVTSTVVNDFPMSTDGRKTCESESKMGESQFIQRKRRLLRKRDRRATFILGAILFSFIICWMPFFTIYILGPANIKVDETAFDVIFWLGYCNSALNPIIYTILNKEFRLAFKKILTCNVH